MHNIDSKKAVIIKAGTAAFLIAALLTGTTACGKEKEHGSNATQTPVSVATPTMIPTPVSTPSQELGPTPTPCPITIPPYLSASSTGNFTLEKGFHT